MGNSFSEAVFKYKLYHVMPAKYFFIQIFGKRISILTFFKKPKFDEMAVMTGCTGEIGSNMLAILLQLNWTVVAGCRRILDGEAILEKLRDRGIMSGTVEFIPLDLSSFESVKKFTEEILNVDGRRKRVTLLINNAAILYQNPFITEDKIERTLQVNYLSHFLLIVLLLPKLIAGGRKDNYSRIVNVSSCASEMGHYKTAHLKELESEKGLKCYSKDHLYCDSKLLQIIASNYLNRKFQEEEIYIRSNSLHPGLIHSTIFKSVPCYGFFKHFSKYFLNNGENGAERVAYVALAPQLEKKGGIYFVNNKPYEPNPESKNQQIQEELWELSCNLINVNPDKTLELIKNPGDVLKSRNFVENFMKSSRALEPIIVDIN